MLLVASCQVAKHYSARAPACMSVADEPFPTFFVKADLHAVR